MMNSPQPSDSAKINTTTNSSEQPEEPLYSLKDQTIAFLVKEAWKGEYEPVDFTNSTNVKAFMVRKNFCFQMLLLVAVSALVITPTFYSRGTSDKDCMVIGLIFSASFLVLVADFALLVSSIGVQHMLIRKTNWMYIGVLTLLSANCITLFSKVNSLWIMWFTPLIIIYHANNTRRLIIGILSVSSKIGTMLILIVLLLLMFSCVIFMSTSGIEGSGNDTLWGTIKNLLILMSTANFPDVMQPLYAKSKWFGWLYVIFIIVMIFMAVNFVLAVIYNSYNLVVKQQYEKLSSGRRQSLAALYSLLKSQEGDYIDCQTIVRLLQYRYPELEKQRIDFLYSIIDPQDNGSVEEGQMRRILVACNLAFVEDPSSYILRWPKFHYIQRNVYFIAFECVMNLIGIILAMTVLFFPEPTLQGDGSSEGVIDFDNFMRYISNIKILIYIIFSVSTVNLAIVAMRFAVYGLRTKWMRFEDYADVFGGLCLIISFIFFIIHDGEMKTADDFSTFIMCFIVVLFVVITIKVVDFIKIMRMNDSYLLLFNAVLAVQPNIFQLFLILFVVLHYFSLIGVWIWGGQMTIDNPLLKGSGFISAKYYTCSTFNSYLDGLMTMFELFIVNNWQVIVDGYVRVSSEAAWIFFISYYFIAALVLNSIIIGFIVGMVVFKLNELSEAEEHSDIAQCKLLFADSNLQVEMTSVDNVEMLKNVSDS